MAEKKYLNADGLIRLVANIINAFAPKEHTHSMTEISDFVPPNMDEIVEAVLENFPRAEEVGF